MECFLRNTLIKCQHVSWFLIKVDLVENWGAGRFVKTSLKLHSNNAQLLWTKHHFSSKKWLQTICISPSFSLKIPKPDFTEILFSVSRNPLAEELSKTSKTGDDFDDLAMTRKIARVWNRSKVPTKSVPLKEIRQASRCPIVF